MCRCKSCNRKLSSRELTRKYDNWEEIQSIEDRYISLCNRCFSGTSIILAEVNPLLSDSDGEVDEDQEEIQDMNKIHVYYQPEEDDNDDLRSGEA